MSGAPASPPPGGAGWKSRCISGNQVKGSWGFVLLYILFLSGCSCGYLGHVASGQARLLASRRSIDKMLKQSDLKNQDRQKIQLILNVKSFTTEHLGLKKSDTYSSYVQLDRRYVSYNLSAAPKDVLEPYTWNFPIVGKLPYKGFFNKEYALREEKKLAEQGYDTYLRGVCAYSTLGYFDDPVVSCMLAYHDYDLVDTIIHELLHQTVWVKGNIHFNESLANFVGERGTLAYLALQYGDSSSHTRAYQDILADTRLFEAFMLDFLNRLEQMYQREISRDEKIFFREKLTEQAKTDFMSVVSEMKTTRYSHFFERIVPNNAILLSFRRYHYDTFYFEEVLAEHGGNLRQMITSFKTLRPGEVPAAFRDRE